MPACVELFLNLVLESVVIEPLCNVAFTFWLCTRGAAAAHQVEFRSLGEFRAATVAVYESWRLDGYELCSCVVISIGTMGLNCFSNKQLSVTAVALGALAGDAIALEKIGESCFSPKAADLKIRLG